MNKIGKLPEQNFEQSILQGICYHFKQRYSSRIHKNTCDTDFRAESAKTEWVINSGK